MTKRFKRGLIAAALLPVLGLGACDNDITSLNENPNAPTVVGPEYLLPSVIQEAVDQLLGTGLDRGVASVWAQHYARLQYGSTDRYDLESTFSDTYWADFWIEPLADVQQVIDLSTTRNRPSFLAAGRIMKSWIFHNMTDLWGDIPYSEALAGDKAEGSTTPVYDTQASIYNAILTDLDGAADLLAGSPSLGNADLIYGGSTAAWQKFANSLRLRVAMRLSETDPATASAQVAAAVADGVFTGAADEAKLQFSGAAPNENPMYTAFRDRPGDYRVSVAMVDTLKSLADPRLTIYADPAESDGEYRGMPNGMNDSHGIGFSTVSKVGTWFLQPDAPAVILSYEEVLFLKAEAAARGWIAGDPATFYAMGVTAALQRFGVSNAAIAAYLAQPRVAYNPATGLTQIALQKWIALYDQGLEAYAEYRRTGVPNLVAGPDNVNENMIPSRLPYPTTEQSLNRANLQAAMERQSGAGINVKLWWDQ